MPLSLHQQGQKVYCLNPKANLKTLHGLAGAQRKHTVVFWTDCSNQTQTTKAQRHKLRTVTHAKKIIFAHITCGIRIIYTAISPPPPPFFFFCQCTSQQQTLRSTLSADYLLQNTKIILPDSNGRSTFEKLICHSSLVVTNPQVQAAFFTYFPSLED